MAKSRSKKIYIPSPAFNPMVLNKKIENLRIEVERHKHLLESVNKANDLHVEHLSNFVRHDMKNAIQGIDGILYNARKGKMIPDEIQQQLDTALDLLRGSLKNFAKLIPSSRSNTTTLPEVLTAVEMLTRSEILNNHIDARFEYDRDSKCVISYSFQALVQVLHNLMINSYNALKEQDNKKLLLKGDICTDKCRLQIYDNGIAIQPENKSLIFNYGYSTTGGSGVGLFHALNVVTEMNGTIDVHDSELLEYTKCFVIDFNPQRSI